MVRPLLTIFLLLVAAGCGDDAPPGTTCSYGGMTYSPGETFPSTDGCNTCSCESSGTVSCSLAFCADAGGSDTATPSDGGGVPCTDDSTCASGAEWCVGGVCVPCDNSGLACDIACADGWQTYGRNGCSPCACAPTSECASDGDCASVGAEPGRCYAGEFCWDWCPAGDPSCCLGNVCSAPGCDTPPPVSCTVRGCPVGSDCGTSTECSAGDCQCDGAGSWGCTRDCIMRTCYAPD